MCQNIPGRSDGKESDPNTGDPGSIPGSGRSPGEGNGCPLQYSCLENFMDRGAWWATVDGITESWTQLSNSHTERKLLTHNFKKFLPGSALVFSF